MDSTVVILALLGYIAWRERVHALERRGRSPRDTLALPAFVRQGKRSRARVLSTEDDGAFNAYKASQVDVEDDDESEDD